MISLWKVDHIPKPTPEKQPYAGSQERVYQLQGKESYIKDIHGSMKNEQHPMKGSGKFEWEAPAYSVFEKVEAEKMQPAAGMSSYNDYKIKEEIISQQDEYLR